MIKFDYARMNMFFCNSVEYGNPLVIPFILIVLLLEKLNLLEYDKGD